MFGPLTPKTVFCFVFLLLMVESIGGQSDTKHFCEALKENQNQIGFSLSVPHKTYFNNYIFTNGYFWKVVYDSSPPVKRQADPNATIDGDPDAPVDAPDDADPASGPVKLEPIYGTKFSTTQFFDVNYKTAFGIKFVSKADPNEWTMNMIGGVSEDYTTVKWVVLPMDPISESETTEDNENSEQTDANTGSTETESPGAQPPRRKRQQTSSPSGTTTEDPNAGPPEDSASDGSIREFDTKFDGFEPQVSFNSMTNINETTVSFIETKPIGDKFKTRFRGFDIPDPEQEWTNKTGEAIQQPFRRKRQSGNIRLIPASVWEMAKYHLIKGVFPIKMSDSSDGVIILMEICKSKDSPCIGGIIYKYCVVSEDETKPTNPGKPCDPGNIQELFDCTNYRPTTMAPVPDGENPPGNDVPPDSNPNEPPGGGPDGGPPPDSSPSSGSPQGESPEESKSMAWLWILIVVIIIIIIVLIVVFMMCSKGKSKEGSGAPPPAEAPGADAGAGAAGSAVAAPPSGEGGVQKTGSGLEKSPSTLSTASTRSKMSTNSSA